MGKGEGRVSSRDKGGGKGFKKIKIATFFNLLAFQGILYPLKVFSIEGNRDRYFGGSNELFGRASEKKVSARN
ncbi:hypothetical protein VB740_15375 [Nostoc sp. UHCC 0251]|nr:hypothetical protein [Nostoc sp. UHCC 0251]